MTDDDSRGAESASDRPVPDLPRDDLARVALRRVVLLPRLRSVIGRSWSRRSNASSLIV